MKKSNIVEVFLEKQAEYQWDMEAATSRLHGTGYLDEDIKRVEYIRRINKKWKNE